MDFLFEPKKLIQAAKDIALEHTKQGELKDIVPDEMLESLIRRIVALDLHQVKRTALALSENEVLRIAAYLPYNYYDVEMENLFLVLNYRSSKQACEILYGQWQMSYENVQCNEYMRKMLKENKDFDSVIWDHHMTQSTYDEILTSNIIAIRFGEACISVQIPFNNSFSDKIEYFGVKKDTKLHMDCEFLFYTFCNREDYLSAKVDELTCAIKKYSENEKKIFLYRFLKMLSLGELDRFYGIAVFFSSFLGDIYMQRCEKFFEDATDEIRLKYRDWLNRFKLNAYFGNDERGRFWKKYQFLSIKKYDTSNAILMEFENYYALEFLGDAMGPAYIYSKTIFNNDIKYWIINKTNMELRSLLLNHKRNKEGMDDSGVYRKEHRGDWKTDIDERIRNFHITGKVKEGL